MDKNYIINNNNLDTIAKPSTMPIDRIAWSKRIGIVNFINSYYQLRDTESFKKNKKILIIGPGQGLDKVILSWRGFEITTFDIDDTFKPDFIGSVHNMSAFHDGDFDVAIASHVLEHLPLEYFQTCLSEIARVSRNALIYLPVNGLSALFHFEVGIWQFSYLYDVCKWWKKPDSLKPSFMSGQHYWEIGVGGCSKSIIKKKIEREFMIKSMYRNHDWRPSMNFVLTSRRFING
jgi:hypothetical protein